MESRLLRHQAREAIGIVEHTLVVEGLASPRTTTGGDVPDSTAARGIPGFVVDGVVCVREKAD
jgi:hypothetical protein